MTEFRRAESAMKVIEGLLSELLSDLPSGEVSDEVRGRFNDLQRHLGELRPIADRMHQKVLARNELEEVKTRLRSALPGSPDDPIRVAEDFVLTSTEGLDVVKPLLEEAQRLEGSATYGAKMVEKVLTLLSRWNAAVERFDSVVVPRLGDGVTAGNIVEERRRAEVGLADADEVARLREEQHSRIAQIVADNDRIIRERAAAEEKHRLEVETAQLRAEAFLMAEEERLRLMEQEEEAQVRALGQNACRQALVTMLSMHVGSFRVVIEGLAGIFSAIVAEPADGRRRVIRLKNEEFREKLGRRPGVWLFFRGAGFDVRPRGELPPELSKVLDLEGGQQSERFLVLSEPNMMGNYEEWVEWHHKLRFIAAFLAALERLAFQKTASLGQHGMDALTSSVLSSEEVLSQWDRPTAQ